VPGAIPNILRTDDFWPLGFGLFCDFRLRLRSDRKKRDNQNRENNANFHSDPLIRAVFCDTHSWEIGIPFGPPEWTHLTPKAVPSRRDFPSASNTLRTAPLPPCGRLDAIGSALRETTRPEKEEAVQHSFAAKARVSDYASGGACIMYARSACFLASTRTAPATGLNSRQPFSWNSDLRSHRSTCAVWEGCRIGSKI
jgi:hypothetical protein